MKKQLEIEVKVGIFVTLGIGLIMIAIIVLGGSQSWFKSQNQFSSHFSNVDGLIIGAKVILDGVPVGIVEDIQFDKSTRNVKILYTVSKEASDWIHKGATVEISTQGVLGDKYINIEGGDLEEPLMPALSDIPPRPSKDLTQFLSKGDQIMGSLNGVLNSFDRILKSFEAERRNDIFFKNIAQVAKNLSVTTEKLSSEVDQIKLKSTISNLNQIFEKVNNGTGTVGALINDPGLYDDLKALLGGANRNRIVRNLVRQTLKEAKTTGSEVVSPK